MKRDPRYAAWLDVADDLEALDEFAYGVNGPFAKFKNEPAQLTSLDVVSWICKKCRTGRWYWWDKGWIGGVVEAPLHSIMHIVKDLSGLYEETEPFAPITVPAFTLIGGIGGGVVGYWLGGKAGQNVYNYANGGR